MFGSDKKGANRPAFNMETLIGAGCTIHGDVSFVGGLHVDGAIVGSVVADPAGDGMLVVSEKGRIEGEIRAPHVVINGQLKGDVVALERIELAAQARVEGNIYYKLLEMAAGAQVCGQIVRQEEPQKALPRPVEVKEARRA
jgi:cytoskeletal protein CcmA (bactofilin family)